MYSPIYIERSRKFRSNYWEIFSPKANRIVRCYSDLEYEHYILVETNPNIVSFCEKPLSISYILDGKNIKSMFDMWIKYKDNKEFFVNIHYSSELDPNNQKCEKSICRSKALLQWCNDNRFNYEIKTDKHIRSNPIYLSNMKTILSYVKRINRSDEKDIYHIISTISSGKLTISHIGNLLSDMPLERLKQTIALMIYRGILIANLDITEFGFQTEVYLDEKKTS